MNTDKYFEASKNSPNIPYSFPQISGKIAWARQIFYEIKRPIVRFIEEGNLNESEFGIQVKNEYLKTARKLKEYEDELYFSWFNSIDENILELLAKNLLTRNGLMIQSKHSGNKFFFD